MISYIEGIGTHQKINIASYKAIFHTLRNHRRFPNYEFIFAFSGTLGPDVWWYKGKHKWSWHVYNPKTGKGTAGLACQKAYDSLVEELIKKKPSMRKAGKIAAWLAHFAVDALTPPHQFGRYKRHPINDWFDPHLNESKSKLAIILDTHVWFEVRVMFYYAFRRIKPAHPNNNFARKRHYRTNDIQKFIEKKARKVYKMRIYHDYKKKGWRCVRSRVDKLLIPEMVSLVSTIWLSAFLESQEIVNTKKKYKKEQTQFQKIMDMLPFKQISTTIKKTIKRFEEEFT
ncbi:hypothetical protein KY330_05690 [Candidatus Woesearchaeota archaeon]|nr:hypothetical protein [Candidatus Woesearchaeota archaeon]